ncbi:MFS transporter [Rhabdobacter roseus]|uniref:MFS family permease n=1 Tax=Rhabdobacter roseus TaxID=1655419 RepID=A0A840TLJ3_9BACT|nr:MFS transporter [Rhabdobacter roseus]MBB5282093.1 MFS family permease [Rhabdobacter roseus]
MKNKYFQFVLCMGSYMFGGTVATLMSVYLPVAVPELIGAAGEPATEARLSEVSAYIGAAFLYGWVVGGLLFGVVSDRIGRMKALIFVTGLYGVATLLTAFASTWQLVVMSRFVTGMGVGGVLLVSTVYLSEVWPERTRPIALGILAVAFPLGIVGSGGLNVFFAEWRQAFWLGSIPILIALAMIGSLVESAAWESTRTDKRALSPNLLDSGHRPNLITGIVVFGSVLIGLWGIFSWLPTWIQSLLDAHQTGQQERGFIMMLLGLGGIAGGMLSGFLVKVMGNRNTLLVTFSGCLLVCLLLFLTNRQFNTLIYLETALLSLFFGLSQGTLSSFIPRLFPTLIRATATGLCFNVGRFFTATAVFFVGALVSTLGGLGNALLFFSLAFFVALVATYLSRDATSYGIS